MTVSYTFNIVSGVGITSLAAEIMNRWFSFSSFARHLAVLRTIESSNLRTIEPSNLRTIESSNLRTIEPSNLRTIESPNLRTIESSNLRTFEFPKVTYLPATFQSLKVGDHVAWKVKVDKVDDGE